MKGTHVGSKHIFHQIAQEFIRQPGVILVADRLAAQLNLTSDQVKRAVQHQRSRNEFWRENIQVVARGGAWQLRANVQPATAQAHLVDVDQARVEPTPTRESPSQPVSRPTTTTTTTREKSSTRGSVVARVRVNIGDLLEVIGFAGQDILARSEETGQVYRVTVL